MSPFHQILVLPLHLLVEHADGGGLDALGREGLHDDLVKFKIQIPVAFCFAPHADGEFHGFVGAAADMGERRGLRDGEFAGRDGVQDALLDLRGLFGFSSGEHQIHPADGFGGIVGHVGVHEAAVGHGD